MAISFQVLRSSTANKRPTPTQLSDGELALNTDNGTGGIFFENSAGNIVKVGPVEIGSSAPNSSPAGESGNSTGELWLDTTNSNNILKIYNGTAWVTIEGISGSAASTGEILFAGTNGELTGDANFTFDADNDILAVTEVEGRLDGPVTFAAKSGEALSAGDVVYVSGVSGNFPVVSKAQANSASTMPAMGFTKDAATGADEDVIVITLGNYTDFDTSTPGFSVNDTLYVSSTTAGGVTNTPPTGEGNLLQNIGKVIRVATSGIIKAGGAGRTNATPNLNEGNIFIGNGSNQATAQALTSALSTEAGISSTATSVVLTLDNTTATFSGDVIQTPSSSITPANNGEVVVEATSDTSLTFKLKGSDGTVRSATLTLS